MNDKQKQAYQDYINGMKYADIAAKYDVSLNTVKSWAARYWRKNKELQPVARKKGGQAGNVNTVKHGAYKKVSWEVLEDDDEAELLENIDYTPEDILKNNYKNLLLRERRLFKLVKSVKEESAGNKDLILGSDTKSKIKRSGSKSESGEDMTMTVHEGIFTPLKIYEGELTKIQAQKIKTAVELKKMLSEEQQENSGTELSKLDIIMKKLLNRD